MLVDHDGIRIACLPPFQRKILPLPVLP
ncbi:hypothetical protein LINPERHAP2_LOCUS16673 [Linum perenne]